MRPWQHGYITQQNKTSLGNPPKDNLCFSINQEKVVRVKLSTKPLSGLRFDRLVSRHDRMPIFKPDLQRQLISLHCGKIHSTN